jgi:hypothetical protein
MPTFTDDAQRLVGSKVDSIELLDWTWKFAFSTGDGLDTESEWRAVSAARTEFTAHDHGHKYGLPAPLDVVALARATLVGRTITRVRLEASTGDLTFEFDGSIRVEFLQLSAGYESWRLALPERDWICTGGGVVVPYPR